MNLRIPNIPFFYLVYRAWSHWCALSGSKHLQFLLDKNLLQPVNSGVLDGVYAQSFPVKKPDPNSKEVGDSMLLTVPMARSIAETLQVPELTVELERAIWQVSTSLKEAQEAEARKSQEANKKEQ